MAIYKWESENDEHKKVEYSAMGSELARQMGEIFGFVAEAEKDWDLNNKIDISLKMKRNITREHEA